MPGKFDKLKGLFSKTGVNKIHKRKDAFERPEMSEEEKTYKEALDKADKRKGVKKFNKETGEWELF